MAGPTKSTFTSSLRVVAVVVFSTLLAFALDSWWGGFQEERQASALAAAVVEELVAKQTSLAKSIERHRAISDAKSRGSTQAVHATAVLAREIWEPRTAALETTLLAFQASSKLSDAGLRIQLGTVLELSEEYREREQRAAAFHDRVRERIAESGLPIYARDGSRIPKSFVRLAPDRCDCEPIEVG